MHRKVRVVQKYIVDLNVCSSDFLVKYRKYCQVQEILSGTEILVKLRKLMVKGFVILKSKLRI